MDSSAMSQADIPRPEHPRPQRRREHWQSLNGEWAFERDRGRSGRERGLPDASALTETITVPFPPESECSGIGDEDFMPAVWYRREVNIPADWCTDHLLLHFGAVDYESEVWVNGRSIGTHRGGYSPFSYDIADVVDPGNNVITVCAHDDVRSGKQPAGKQSTTYATKGVHYQRITGIWQSVWLEPLGPAYIEDIRLTPDLASGVLNGTVGITGARIDAVEIRVAFEGATVGQTTVPVAGNRATWQVELAAVHPWTPEDPCIYDVTIRLHAGMTVVDELETYTGIRSISVEDGIISLNGEPRFQRLVLDQGYHPGGLYTAPTDEAYIRDIELGKSFGFDGARLHQKVFDPRFLYHADRLGYLVWGEFGDWKLDQSNPGHLGRVLDEWITVVVRDYNHPCIVGWTPFNESPAGRHPDLQRTVYRATKAIDPTRPVIDTSGYRHVETDILDIHDYTQNVDTFRERYAPLVDGASIDPPYEHWNDEPGPPLSYVSEFGGIWWNPAAADGWGYGNRPESEAAFLDRYRGLTEALLENSAIGMSCYTQLYDIESEVNGLASFDREPKMPPARIREITSQPAAIEPTG